jgi:hypothetical protein
VSLSIALSSGSVTDHKIPHGFTIVEIVRPSILAPNFKKLLNKLTILSGQTGGSLIGRYRLISHSTVLITTLMIMQVTRGK